MNHQAKNEKAIKDIFTQHYHQYSRAIYRFCLARLGSDAHKAEDCVQNTFIVFYRKLQQGEEIRYPGTFLFRTADKIVLNTLSKASKENTISLDEANEATVNNINETDSEIDYALLIEKISVLLNPEEFLLFRLKYIEELTLEAASERLHISKPAAAKRLQRIREKIKNAINADKKGVHYEF